MVGQSHPSPRHRSPNIVWGWSSFHSCNSSYSSRTGTRRRDPIYIGWFCCREGRSRNSLICLHTSLLKPKQTTHLNSMLSRWYFGIFQSILLRIEWFIVGLFLSIWLFLGFWCKDFISYDKQYKFSRTDSTAPSCTIPFTIQGKRSCFNCW